MSYVMSTDRAAEGASGACCEVSCPNPPSLGFFLLHAQAPAAVQGGIVTGSRGKGKGKGKGREDKDAAFGKERESAAVPLAVVEVDGLHKVHASTDRACPACVMHVCCVLCASVL